MTSTTTRKIAAFAGAATLALGVAGTAQARHGADDPVPHARHHAHHHHHHNHVRHNDDGPNHT